MTCGWLIRGENVNDSNQGLEYSVSVLSGKCGV